MYMGVSKNRGIPKWMVCNGSKPYQNGWFGGTITFGNTHVYSLFFLRLQDSLNLFMADIKPAK